LRKTGERTFSPVFFQENYRRKLGIKAHFGVLTKAEPQYLEGEKKGKNFLKKIEKRC